MRHKRTDRRWRAAGVTAALVLALAAPARSAIVDSAETFATGRSGWQHYNLIDHDPMSLSLSEAYEDGALKIGYRTRRSLYAPVPLSPPGEVLVRALSGASSGAFTGDVVTPGARGFSFRLYASHEAFVRVLLRGADGGGWWEFLVPVSNPGSWTTLYVPFRASYWYNQIGSSDATTLEQDLQNVEWVGVTVQQGDSLDAQVFRVDDFMLMSEDPLFVGYMAQYDDGSGLNLAPEDDLDGDGVSNYNEWIAGTAAGDEKQYFTVRADEPGSSFTLNWASAPNKKYQVLRTFDLGGGFAPIGTIQDATPPENEFTDTTAGDGPAYYKIEVWDPTLQDEAH